MAQSRHSIRKGAYQIALMALIVWIGICVWRLVTARSRVYEIARDAALNNVRLGISPFGITPQAMYANVLFSIAVRLIAGVVILGGLAIILRPRGTTAADRSI